MTVHDLNETESRMKSIIRWPGGKWTLKHEIIGLMPDTDMYVEGCLGGGAILLNRKKSQREIANDIDKQLIRMWKSVQQYPHDILQTLKGITHSTEAFDEAYEWLGSDDDIIFAAGYIIRNRMSYSGLGRKYTWSDRLRRQKPGYVAAWDTLVLETFPKVVERIRNVEFHYKDVSVWIHQIRNPDTVIYLDFPYLHSTRVASNIYTHEMSTAKHRELLSLVQNHPSKIFISGYHSELYDSILKNWTCFEFDVVSNGSYMNKIQTDRVEVVWTNQTDLFTLFQV